MPVIKSNYLCLQLTVLHERIPLLLDVRLLRILLLFEIERLLHIRSIDPSSLPRVVCSTE